MRPNDWFAGRFEIVDTAGVGASSTVYRATDLISRRQVALKVLGKLGTIETERFARESKLLSKINHPHIVEYVAHGTTGAGDSWLALEWLSGQTLARRLAEGTLPFTDAKSIGIAIANALGTLHERGVVHRDIKPANIFLVDGQADSVKVLDLGVARMTYATNDLTQEGMVVGTPGFMSPEQARGEKTVNGAADIFSLGAVLYTCLSGVKPFEASDTIGTLLNVVLEDPKPLAEITKDLPTPLPDALVRLVHAMLEKTPAHRPTIEEVAFGLGEETTNTFVDAPWATSGGKSWERFAFGAVERSVRSIVLARDGRDDSEAGVLRAQSELTKIGMELTRLYDGTLIVRTDMATNSSEAAVRAARAASVLSTWLPGAAIAIASGRTPTTEELARSDSLREIVARARELLDEGPSGRPRVDEATASLLEQRFAIETDNAPDTGRAGHLLGGERDLPVGRRLFGQVSSFVGRELDLMFLLAELDDCVLQSRPRSVLVTGDAGIGKSRLYAELLQSLPRIFPDACAFIAHADPSSSGAALDLLSRLLAPDLAIDPEAPRGLRRKLLIQRARDLCAPKPEVTAAFLGEIIGTQFDDNTLDELRAARADARLMADHLTAALTAWIQGKRLKGPVVLVFDDLHWGDWATVRLVDLATRRLSHAPVFCLWLARNDIHDRMPELKGLSGWIERPLGPLDERAVKGIIDRHLGSSSVNVDQLVSRASGNPFFVEEFIRALARGGSANLASELPEATLALVEERFTGLSGYARRALRAGGILGGGFSLEAVRFVMGEEDAEDAPIGLELAAACSQIVEAEVFVRQPGRGYAFAHDLYREAAYRTLTDEDKKSGHRFAAEWLERAGSPPSDPLAIAHHLEHAEQPSSAAKWYALAAARALDAGDFATASGFAACAAQRSEDPTIIASAGIVAAESRRWQGAHADAETHATEALRLLPRGSTDWYTAWSEAVVARGRLGQREGLMAALEDLASVEALPAPGEEASRRRTTGIAFLALHLLTSGGADAASHLFEELARVGASSTHPEVLARVHQVTAFRGLFNGDLATYLVASELAASCFEAAGDLREACVQRVNVGNASAQLGDFGRATDALESALMEADRMGIEVVGAYVKHNLALVRARLGDIGTARELVREALQTFEHHGDRRMIGATRVYAAMIELQTGDAVAAAQWAKSAADSLTTALPAKACALGVLAVACAARLREPQEDGARAETLSEGQAALHEAELLASESRGVEEGEAWIHLAAVELLQVEGRHDEARSRARRAVSRLEERAARIGDAAARTTFLEKVPEHVRIRALAQSSGGLDSSAS